MTGVDDVHARLDGLEVAHGRHARSEVAVQVDGQLDRRFEGLDHGIGVVGGDQAGHVLDADGVGAHGLQVLGLVDIVVQVVDLAAQTRFGHGVADAALEVLAVLLDLGHHGLEIAVVVEGVEGAEDVHAVFAGAVHEGVGHVVGVVAVAHQVLGPQQHGEGGLLEVALQGADALPGIFVEKAVHGVEGGAAPGLHGPEAHLVHQFGHRDHVLGAPAGGEQALVAVAQAQIHDLHRVFRLGPLHIVVHLGHFDLIVVTHRMGLLLKNWMFNGSLDVVSSPILAESVEGFHLHEASHLHHALPAGHGPQVALVEAAGLRPLGGRHDQCLFFGLDIGAYRGKGGGQSFFICVHKSHLFWVRLAFCQGRYMGMLPCFFGGRSSRLLHMTSRASISRGRVWAGSMTASI